MKEPIFQPEAGWMVLAMVLTIAFSWLFTYFVSAPIAERAGEMVLRPALTWLGLL